MQNNEIVDQTHKRSSYIKEYYKKNKQYYLDRAANKRAEFAKFINDIKAAMPCKECGESNIACLDFHHRDPTTKLFNIGSMVNGLASKDKILAEIAKCDVLCCNCHRKLHWSKE